MKITIALDAMGGDNAPHIVINGAVQAYKKNSNLFFLIYGDEEKVQPLISKHPELTDCSIFIHTPEFISNETKVASAIRGIRNSSMRLAIQAVRDKKAKAVISAGNTGAYMALSKITLKTLTGIERPAIATSLPTLKTPCLALDLGANVDCSADNLVEFSLMGHVMACRLFQLTAPRIGLLNIGSEELKGNNVVQLAYQKLKAIKNINFLGFVEGDDLTSGRVDVLITDGFTGNVALKTMEGTARLVVKTLQESLESSWKSKIGYFLARKSLKKMKEKMDPRLHNGAIFLGLKGIAIKSHGGTDEVGFANSIEVACRIIQNSSINDLGTEIEAWIKNYSLQT